MKKIFTFCLLFIAIVSKAQLLTTNPEFPLETSSPVEIIMDATKGNLGLKDYASTSDVYVHIAVITSFSSGSSDWRYVKFGWATTDPLAQATYVSANKWKYTITGGLRNFFGLSNPSEQILRIVVLFRNGNGSRVQRNIDGSDMYVMVYQPGLQVKLTTPLKQPKYTPIPEPMNVSVGDGVPASALANETSTLKLYLNGVQFGSTATNATTISATAVITTAGTQTLVAETNNGLVTKYDTLQFVAAASTVIQDLPAGVVDGINYDAGGTSATLVLYAPGKTNVAVIGEFNNWSPTASYQLKKTTDGNRFWLQITGLTPGVEYAYQYLVEGTLKIADPYAEKVLDPSNDQYISSGTYPGMKAYPAGQSGIVSVLQTQQPSYTWATNSFVKPDKRNLLIYELLLRDFVAAHDWKTLKDTLSYLKRLGINAIEVMPFNEFEGNLSWGYNGYQYFAPDKYYGPKNTIKEFIDTCHKYGIAVIMDIVLNHTYGPSPLARLYWDANNNRPAANNPWYNSTPPHSSLSFGDDFNHESAATKYFFNRVLQHWINEYKIDGYRVDFSKGLTQKATSSDAAMAAYDASRIAIIKNYFNSVKAVDPNAYFILEHFADNNEEKELSDSGMLLWASVWTQYQEASMGYLGNSNFQGGIYTSKGWTNPGLVTFMESHDEERITYKNIKYGNAAGGYSVKDTATALKRMELNASFLLTIPGPKMIYEFGEVGYDYSRCYLSTNGEGGDCNTKTDSKPIRWDYQNNANRKAVYNVYSKLLKLRNVPNFLSTFVTNNIAYNVSGAFKTLQVISDSLKLVVIGNFDVVSSTGSVTFPNSGVWYDYLSGGVRVATGSSENITLQPGEYHVYTNRDAAPLVAALPLRLISFDGNRAADHIGLTWQTSNEINVNRFELERSFDGSDFNVIAIKAATNNSSGTINKYGYNDRDQKAVKATGKMFYRLKLIDNDGKSTVSKIVVINADRGKEFIALYPNPVTNSTLYVDIENSIQNTVKITVEDISGKTMKQYSMNVNSNGSRTIPVNVQQLYNGVYILKVETTDKVFVQQFIIQK